MPAKSKNQQQAAGQALAAKRGELAVSKLQGAAKDMYDSMSEKELEKFAKTKHDGLPDKVEEGAGDMRLLKVAVKRGANAAKAKKKRSPLMDPKFIKMIDLPGARPGKDSPYFKAWLKGFDMERMNEVRQIVREMILEELSEGKPEFEVKYAKSKSGPIKVTKFMTKEEAFEFLAKMKADGFNGIVSRAGKPIKESRLNENEDHIHQAIAEALKGVKDSKGRPVRYAIETVAKGNRGEIKVSVYGSID